MVFTTSVPLAELTGVEPRLRTRLEGGLVVTDREDVAERVRSLRILGEDLSTEERLYVSATRGSNLKLSSVLAAFTRSQLARFWDYQHKRDANTPVFVDRLAALPGIVVPTVPDDRTHMWHMLRFLTRETDPLRARRIRRAVRAGRSGVWICFT